MTIDLNNVAEMEEVKKRYRLLGENGELQLAVAREAKIKELRTAKCGIPVGELSEFMGIQTEEVEIECGLSFNRIGFEFCLDSKGKTTTFKEIAEKWNLAHTRALVSWSIPNTTGDGKISLLDVRITFDTDMTDAVVDCLKLLIAYLRNNREEMRQIVKCSKQEQINPVSLESKEGVEGVLGNYCYTYIWADTPEGREDYNRHMSLFNDFKDDNEIVKDNIEDDLIIVRNYRYDQGETKYAMEKIDRHRSELISIAENKVNELLKMIDNKQ